MRPLAPFRSIFLACSLTASVSFAGPTLVELFTSEGCSSCPPADAYLHELARSPAARSGDTILIAWHVDYWDNLGWKEPFSIPLATQRQRDYAAAMDARGTEGAGVYTPQMIVNGHAAFVGSDRVAGRGALSVARGFECASLNVSLSLSDDVATISTSLPELPPNSIVIGVLVEDGLRSKVTAGENAGRTLTHDRVARAASPATVAGGTATIRLDVPRGVDRSHASVVVFAQSSDMGDVIAIGSKPLSDASTPPAAASTPANASAGAERYHTLDIGTKQLRYALLLPDNFDPAKPHPVLLALPPGAQDEAMVETGLRMYWEAEAKRRGWIVVSPINPDFAKLFESRLDPLAKLMDDVGAQYTIEGGKPHLAGVSNGGRAAFVAALEHPDRYASLTVLPGLMARGAARQRVKALANMPLALYVGGEDPTWVHKAERTRDDLKKAGVDCSLTIRDGEGHVMPIPPAELFDLLDSRRH
ncbi:MAG: DUF1223 domain-containing protein [Phycisphaerales bacterium]|jgi:predicted esterase|nr:DUF1223 domain-containing protein [Phycisphaerales bacterium]